jgi:hypothetical protein
MRSVGLIPLWKKSPCLSWKQEQQELVGERGQSPSGLLPVKQCNDAVFPVMWPCHCRFLSSRGMNDQMLKQRMCRKLARESKPAVLRRSLQPNTSWTCAILRLRVWHFFRQFRHYKSVYFVDRDPILPVFPGTVPVLWVLKNSLPVSQAKISFGTTNVLAFSRS